MRFVFLLLVLAISVSCGDVTTVNQTEELIDSLTAKNKVNNWPRMGSLSEWKLSVDTYTHEVPSSTIESLYYVTCKKLDSLYGEQVETYHWNDIMGYSGQVTIVQFENEVRGSSVLVARVFEANDNDNFSFSYGPGTYDVSSKTKRSDWKLESILRCNQVKAEQNAAEQPATAPQSKPK